MIKIKIQKKDLYIISALLVFLIGAGFAIAYGTSNPAIMGHSINEIERCAEGQILKVSGGNWVCSADVTGGGGVDTRCDTSGTCSQVCIGTACRTTWPVDTDTRCDTSGRCTQVCIGSSCITRWPRSTKTFAVCARAPDDTTPGNCVCSGSTQISKVSATGSSPCTASSATGSCSASCWVGASVGACGSCCVCQP